MDDRHERLHIQADEEKLEHASDILDYFRDKREILASGALPPLERHSRGRHAAVNRTARALTENRLCFVAARELHPRTKTDQGQPAVRLWKCNGKRIMESEKL